MKTYEEFDINLNILECKFVNPTSQVRTCKYINLNILECKF